MAKKSSGPANLFAQHVNLQLQMSARSQQFTLVELQEASGVSKSRLGAVINQNKAPLTLNELSVICEALNLDPADVVRRAEISMHEELRGERHIKSQRAAAA